MDCPEQVGPFVVGYDGCGAVECIVVGHRHVDGVFHLDGVRVESSWRQVQLGMGQGWPRYT